jgi:hypothetical protein
MIELYKKFQQIPSMKIPEISVCSLLENDDKFGQFSTQEFEISFFPNFLVYDNILPTVSTP